MPSKPSDMNADVQAIAQAAALKRKQPRAPLSWSEALSEAPWNPKKFPSPWERDFRVAYATALLARGKEFVRKPNTSGSATSSGKTDLPRRQVTAPQEEFDEHDRRWRAAGEKSWSSWARKKLLE
jgi:hypothetical protein